MEIDLVYLGVYLKADSSNILSGFLHHITYIIKYSKIY